MTQHSHTIPKGANKTASVTDPDLTPLTGRVTKLEAGMANVILRVAAVEAHFAPPPVTPPPPPPPPPPPTGGAFLSYPTSAALNFVGAHDVEVTAKTLRAITGGVPALRFEGVNNIHVHNVDFADFPTLGSPAILCLSCTGLIVIEDNRGRECGRNFVQFDKTVASGFIRRNKVLGGSGFEDVISMYMSGGTSGTDLFQIVDNAIEVDDWVSGSGSGMMLADNGGGHILEARNTLLNPGQVGIGIAGGSDIHVVSNVIYGKKMTGSNVGIYAWNQGGPASSGIEVSTNRVFWLNAAGTLNSYWDGGNVGTIAGESTNTWDDATIVPAALAVVL